MRIVACYEKPYAMASRRQVAFASGSAALHSREAVQHGIKQEGPAIECVSRALGVRFYPVAAVTSLHLGDFEIRVKPDGGNDIVPQ